ncbi:MAG: type II toxin-antitoxin system prevent-host-death family antitoxin [Pedosphaera sp.]|nr:type II toxin-antitoxin system prevent-host-death family antitoxin [Pedosphaera sp.]
MTKLNIHEAKSNLSRLVTEVESGAEVVICRGNNPVAKLVPYHKGRSRRPKVGEVTSGPVRCQPGCFAPLSDDELTAWGMG